MSGSACKCECGRPSGLLEWWAEDGSLGVYFFWLWVACGTSPETPASFRLDITLLEQPGVETYSGSHFLDDDLRPIDCPLDLDYDALAVKLREVIKGIV